MIKYNVQMITYNMDKINKTEFSVPHLIQQQGMRPSHPRLGS